MLINIVLLYMAITYDLPRWCKVFVLVSMAIRVGQFLVGIYKAGADNNDF